MKFEYIESIIAENTNKKSIINAYDRNDISILSDGKIYYFEKCRGSENFVKCVKNEIKRLYPELIYLYDL